SKESVLVKSSWFAANIIWIGIIRVIQFFGLNPVYFSTGKKKKVLEAINSSTYVFCIGAERINDVFIKTLFLSLEALRIYQRSGKKLIHLSLTIGPLFHASSMRKASVVLNNSHAIFVRDQKSFEWLEKLKVTSPAIYNSYD